MSWLSTSFNWGSGGEIQQPKSPRKAQSTEPRLPVCERAGKRSRPPTALPLTRPCKEGQRLCKHLREKEELTNGVTHFNTFTFNTFNTFNTFRGNANFARAQWRRHLQRGSAKKKNKFRFQVPSARARLDF